jgi:hypothetical protein
MDAQIMCYGNPPQKGDVFFFFFYIMVMKGQ